MPCTSRTVPEKGLSQNLARSGVQAASGALPNSCKKLTAARLPLPGLKPLFSPETNGVMPLADLFRRLLVSRGNRHAAWAARTRGLAAAYATNVSQTDGRVAPQERSCCAERNGGTAKLQRFNYRQRYTSPSTG